MSSSSNIIPHHYRIHKADRVKANGHQPCIVWFTGLSGSGKSTLANGVEQVLFKKGIHTYVLDGDNIRYGLNNNVDFSPDGRKENIRRIGEVSKLFIDAGMVVLTAFISPFRNDREMVRRLVDLDEFIEIYVDCPIEVCQQRDVKGLYKRAISGEIPEFTGISSPFEAPENPELVIRSAEIDVNVAVDQICNYLLEKILPLK